jgi:hypothetical protein
MFHFPNINGKTISATNQKQPRAKQITLSLVLPHGAHYKYCKR